MDEFEVGQGAEDRVVMGGIGRMGESSETEEYIYPYGQNGHGQGSADIKEAWEAGEGLLRQEDKDEHEDVWGAIAFHTRTDDKCFHRDLAIEIKFQKELPVTVIMSEDMDVKDGRNRKENVSAKEMGITYLDPQPETRNER